MPSFHRERKKEKTKERKTHVAINSYTDIHPPKQTNQPTNQPLIINIIHQSPSIHSTILLPYLTPLKVGRDVSYQPIQL